MSKSQQTPVGGDACKAGDVLWAGVSEVAEFRWLL